ncbi:hypothetical protein DAPPUDRAFT_301907 [Daphnia pulex]|uniref:RZ-type domain-containing protein n=1 Tax=Daphnia pulex TaxID=6669 RepID=E9GAG6_DAPPU|nr:hypothetical protein DAPPUDRAFT_301907 [Daphnia pulex]|eukprot:EFX83237.1 hypothetical protein DAPPUDRAFT_301907 [Daphnia pulex]
MIHLKPPDDFRQLSVMPECEDVCADIEPFLRPNLIKGSYPNVDTYLDIQFRLLREDFLNPLREGLVAYRTKAEKQQNQHIRVDNIRLYYDVKISDDENPGQQQLYTLQFSTKGFQRVNWEGSKRLIYGSLLLLSADNFSSFMLFTVVDRKPEQLSRGRIKAKFEGESLPTYAKKTNLVMAESSVFFEAYRSVLIALQRISPAHFPMEDYILCRNVLPTEPDYLKRIPNVSGQLLSSTLTRLLVNVSLFSHSLPDNETLGLDPSQAEALYAALTRKLVVIQGPPGTGKTYLGLKIVQTLLHNKRYWVGVEKPKPTPILVICYTNHALDQFLEGIMKFTKKIVRIGGQSKCDALQPFMLIEWKKQAAAQKKRPLQYRRWLAESRSNLNETRSALQRSQTTQRIVESFVIIHENCLLNLKVLSQKEYTKVRAMHTTSNSTLTQWLGVQSIQTLKETVRALEKIMLKTKKPLDAIEKVSKDEELDEEVWDKEDVDEIQGERMMDDEVHVRQSDFAGVKMKSDKTIESEGNIQYAFSTQTLNQKINSLQDSLQELEGDDVELVQFHIAEIKLQKELFEEILKILPTVDKKEYKQLIERDLVRLSFVDRWKIYSFWRAEISNMLAAEINLLYRQYQQQTNEMKDVETIETAEIIREAHVVGITTTGAAKNRALLEHLKSKIVVVEEAAEVLEAHIVTSMSSSCEHLILIGDHKQLRPPTTVYTLAKDYHLDVSLFERLVMNGVEPNVLGVQHRMRPDVARLIVPSIYPHLENHQSVLRYWDVPGMVESVFFLSHLEREKGDQSDQESRSHLNPFEADMALALARHLLMQGLEPSQITILTTYSGQLLHFKKLRRSHAILQGVRISIVDNFQGEENDIIILSLVRSNDEAKVGFLKTENRVCVALSRAKKGFYLIGNMSNLAGSSKLWREVNKVLTSNGQIGPHFDLQCEVHHTVIKVLKQTNVFSSVEEIKCPEQCGMHLDCDHICNRICHMRSSHAKMPCTQPCRRFTCPEKHPCPKQCYEECGKCLVDVFPKVVTLPDCGHKVEIACSDNPETAFCPKPCDTRLDCGHQCTELCHKCHEDCDLCITKINRQLPCGHSQVAECSPVVEQAQVEKFLQECPHKCRANLPCEHSCKGSCGQCFNGRLHKACEEKCGRTLVCGHNCGVNCAISCPPCKEVCQYRCRHSRCRKKCCEPCVDCVEPCGWKCEHYSCSLKCFEYCNRPRCDEPCRKRLPCGHSCVGLCGEICPPLCRVCHKDQLTEFILYGNEEEDDARFIYLEDCQHTIEVEGMDHWMEMKEEETREIQMKCCPRCKTIIRSCYRYGNVIKKNFEDIVEVKRMLLRNRVSSKEIIEKLLNQIKDSDALNSELAGKLNHDITEVLKNELKCIRDSLNPNMVGKRQKYKNRAQNIVISLFHRERFSVQEYDCFIAEVNRLDLIRVYFLIKSASHMSNRNSLISEETRLVEDLLMKNTKPLKKQESETIKGIFQRIGKKLNTGLGISETEREQIVKAMGFKQGHWFKCPNGHIYLIADCGGAMHEAKCNECGEKIGGGNHSLRSDNSLAREMDGARFAAWSEHANNMGNFQILD